ncbi:MAG: hypothetical protein COU35_01055 [Candidatus Magasanikbacteria bacterium CG10_big_fil_rev_8_21_14_0_10_47_10]|uniref:PEGA domain-containing protein n=1 Tax=Candidatus Magasanikbacteria bacterium CG10_big_fil_rev_8_21_14_0_10_47_10 TaxID=1974652 RepID=A0A2H0TRE2_9BACT|nr:MAG: hypothetical protein COU35_01055 [Candidatus Magasanikbacteria bacterium CG10_big_fil_rev_8_21_14_0_10_47_10]
MMITLIAIFFVSSPLIILYTNGYRYDLASGAVLSTGVLSVDVKPDDARVELDGVVIEQGIPIRKQNLAPNKSYQVHITRDGYLSWDKDIFVGSNQTAYIRNVTLFRDTSPFRRLQDDDTAQYLSISRDGLLALTTEKHGTDMTLVLKRIETGENIFATDITASTQIAYRWSPQSSGLFLELKNDDVYSQLLTDFGSTNSMISTSSLSLIDQMQWDDRGRNVYVQGEMFLERWRVADHQKLGRNVQTVWYVDSSEKIWTYNREVGLFQGDRPSEIPNLPVIQQVFFASNDVIIAKTEGAISIIRPNSDAWDIRRLPVDAVFYNTATNSWIAWSPWEFWRVDTRGDTGIINRTGGDLLDIVPLDENGVLLLARADSLTAFNPSYFVDHMLEKDIVVEQVTANIKTRKIYFLGSVKNVRGVYELEY